MKTLKQSILSIAIGLALVAGISYAWTGAPGNPPNLNTPAPINTGSSGQAKIGKLTIGTSVEQAPTSGLYVLGTARVGGLKNYGDSVFDGNVKFVGNVGIGTVSSSNAKLYLKAGNGSFDPYAFRMEQGSQIQAGDILTSEDMLGNAYWAHPISSKPRLTITQYGRDITGTTDLGYHYYCSLSIADVNYSQSSTDKVQFYSGVYPTSSAVDNLGRNQWYFTVTRKNDDYTQSFNAICFDFN